MDKSRIEPTIFLIEKISFSLKLFSEVLITQDKGSIFFSSQWKHIVWIFIWSVSMRCYLWAPPKHFIWKYYHYSVFGSTLEAQGLHRLEKYLNTQDCLEKSLKIKFALKSTGKTLKGLEKSLDFIISGVFHTVFWDLNQYKIVVSLCCTKKRHHNCINIF